jgi:hypothetical protein
LLVQVAGESDEVYLQFHARRTNYQCFTLHIAENVDEAFGEIQIFAVKPKKSFREENKDFHLENCIYYIECSDWTLIEYEKCRKSWCNYFNLMFFVYHYFTYLSKMGLLLPPRDTLEMYINIDKVLLLFFS